jgi:hypothetical protein
MVRRNHYSLRPFRRTSMNLGHLNTVINPVCETLSLYYIKPIDMVQKKKTVMHIMLHQCCATFLHSRHTKYCRRVMEAHQHHFAYCGVEWFMALIGRDFL